MKELITGDPAAGREPELAESVDGGLTEVEAVRRAKARARNVLLLAPLFFVMVAFFFLTTNDWLYLLGVGAMGVALVVQMVREYRHPDRLLQTGPGKIMKRVFARHEGGATGAPREGESPIDALVRLQAEMDILSAGDHRAGVRFMRRFGGGLFALGAAVWIGVGVVTVAVGAPMGLILSLACAAFSGAVGWVVHRQEKRRARAVALLDEEMAEQRAWIEGPQERAPDPGNASIEEGR